jgi:mannitol/fructose-specific phosphotransferase system IIA component (Ntr-type)
MASLSPKLNMMVIYPSEESADSRSVFENTGIATYDLKRLFDQSRIAVKISNTDAKAVLVTLLSGHFQGQPSYVEQLSRELLSKAESSPIDIATGTILLHAHPALVKQPIAFLATLKESAPFSPLDHSHSSKIVLVLLSPASLSASDHLQYLARIARSLHDYADVAAIENSSNPNEILSLLNSV